MYPSNRRLRYKGKYRKKKVEWVVLKSEHYKGKRRDKKNGSNGQLAAR